MNLSTLTSGAITIGLELPLDNDWAQNGQRQRMIDKRPFGVPDLSEHQSLATLADELGFRALCIQALENSECIANPDFAPTWD